MEMIKVEAIVLQKATNEATAYQLAELSDSQLALIGGGGGDVVFA